MSKTTVQVGTPACMVCRRTSIINMPLAGWTAWQDGALIQDALPMLTPDEREMLMTGTHPDCFDSIFGEDE